MIRFAITIFLSAVLLFQVQPLVGKYILPWFGGSPSVWTVCMLFFQSLLVVGYAYAHAIARLKPKHQCWIHLCVLTATIFLLPITPAEQYKPVDAENPTWRILLLLLICVGGPYVILSSTAPLLQSWFARRYPSRSPYRLYALSNAGSLLGLFAYPFAVEPVMKIDHQTILWSCVYILFLITCAACAVHLRRVPETSDSGVLRRSSKIDDQADQVVSRGMVALWLMLSACGSVMLLATTNKMCQDVASVPLLWVLPLGIYLLSFIAMFGHKQCYHRNVFGVAMMFVVVVCIALALGSSGIGLLAQVGCLTFILAVTCCVCHGELAQLQPTPKHLTFFYLTISVGGAIGGVLVTIVAPVIFVDYHEFNLGILVCLGLLLLSFRRDRWSVLSAAQRHRAIHRTWMIGAIFGVGVVLLQWTTIEITEIADSKVLEIDRNFYGSLRIVHRSANVPQRERVVMSHGKTIHGVQFRDPGLRQTPTMYYASNSGVGIAIEQHPRRSQPDQSLRIGVIGLGAGTISCYARKADVCRFYEINPLVARMADEHFTFLADAKARGAHVDVLLGDARIVMERQLAAGEPQQFDVLVVDAFSSDAIPLHLLTVQCGELYHRHLAPGGTLAFHVSNHYLDLRPAVRGLATSEEQAIWVQRTEDDPTLAANFECASISEWVLLTSNHRFIGNPVVQQAAQRWPPKIRDLHLTDSFSSLFSLLR
ncbi:MAG: fused MFS/spermidine synthase [Pirellulaceae bacterium]|nr:fused MFS/spermidine synthase [Pirellulaceae bacterium]